MLSVFGIFVMKGASLWLDACESAAPMIVTIAAPANADASCFHLILHLQKLPIPMKGAATTPRSLGFSSLIHDLCVVACT
ncbi:MAG: hypothetical protein ABIP39_11200, partial [Polyangiaceae bacterium]